MIKLNLNGRDTTVGLDADTPQPGAADIDAALCGNLRGCGADRRIRAAIHRAATFRAGA